MAPETGSRGVTPPSRVHHASPTLQQVQFPSRRTKVRRRTCSRRQSPRQQTLTQIDFVSSFEEDDDVVAVRGGDGDAGRDGSAFSNQEDDDKENAPPTKAGAIRHMEQTNHDDGPRTPRRRKRMRTEASTKEISKRRRTMGDDDDDQKKETRRADEKSRRRTLGHMAPSSNHDTQTLTQLLGHQTSFVADSDEELCGPGADDDDQDEGFLSWLGNPGPGRPSAGRGRPRPRSPAAGATAKGVESGQKSSRENSVIPQTPVKRSATIRLEPSSGRVPSPTERMMDRYGAPDGQESPLKKPLSPMDAPRQGEANDGTAASPPLRGQAPSLEIQDSCATEGWTTPSKSQTQARGTPEGTPKSAHVPCTPSKPGTMQDDPSLASLGTPKRREKSSPMKMTTAGLYEIPDSDEDGDLDDVDEEENNGQTCGARYGAGVATQAVMSEIASAHEHHASAPESPSPEPLSRPSQNDQMPPPGTRSRTTPRSTIKALRGAKEGALNGATTTTLWNTTPAASEPIRRPLHHPSRHHHTQPSQPLESQRVPVLELQSLPPPSARSDVILPISPACLEALITGHTIAVTTSFVIPRQVVRFWLLETHLLRYMATVEPGVRQQQASRQSCSPSTWRFHAPQVYELNNPVQEQDMLEEGWVKGHVARHAYLPPAVVGQLLWNLRHALFEPGPDGPAPPPRTGRLSNPSLPAQEAPRRRATSPPGSMTVSQRVTAQIHSDMASSTQQLPTSDDVVPSTPDKDPTRKPGPSSTEPCQQRQPQPSPRESTQPGIHPSQATTLSQASTPEKSSPPPHNVTKSCHVPPPAENSIQFPNPPDSLSSLPFPSSLDSTSQLLTKSQLLPDSLIRDHAPPCAHGQPEIWDSDDEDVSL